jgi:hypothetical protein
MSRRSRRQLNFANGILAFEHRGDIVESRQPLFVCLVSLDLVIRLTARLRNSGSQTKPEPSDHTTEA